MKKATMLTSLLFCVSTAVWAESYDIKTGLPAEVYMTCADADKLAKTDSAYIADVVAVMGNASVSSRKLHIQKTEKLDAEVIEKLNKTCASDPQMLLITAIDNTMRELAK